MIGSYKVDEYIVRYITHKVPHLFEIMDGLFDDALELIASTESSLIFGGFIRDVVAGETKFHDLDIATSEESSLRSIFMESPRWAPLNAEEPELIKSRPRKIKSKTQKTIEQVVMRSVSDTNGYDKFKKRTGISKISSFVNASGYHVQFINHLKVCSREAEEFITLKLIENLDLVCCGMAINKRGDVIELLPNAFEDSSKKIITINPLYKGPIEKSMFEGRIKKLVDRGWSYPSDIDTDLMFLTEKREAENKNCAIIKDGYKENVAPIKSEDWGSIVAKKKESYDKTFRDYVSENTETGRFVENKAPKTMIEKYGSKVKGTYITGLKKERFIEQELPQEIKQDTRQKWKHEWLKQTGRTKEQVSEDTRKWADIHGQFTESIAASKENEYKYVDSLGGVIGNKDEVVVSAGAEATIDIPVERFGVRDDVNTLGLVVDPQEQNTVNSDVAYHFSGTSVSDVQEIADVISQVPKKFGDPYE